MSRNLIDTVELAVRHKFPHYPITTWVIKAAILATLDAIREPSEAMLTAANSEEVGHPWATLAWQAMIDALRAEIDAGN
jgi:hypothetical protein